jgi:hypothetical protein
MHIAANFVCVLVGRTNVRAAGAVGVPTPVAYKLRRGAAARLLARGMNFAVGGSGVLDTGYLQRNLSEQIDQFQAQRPAPAGCEVAVVVVSGNDYAFAADKNNSTSVRNSTHTNVVFIIC